MNEKTENNGQQPTRETLWGKFASALKMINSPLRFFALAVLVCNTVFGAIAGFMRIEKIFAFSVHMFLAIVGAVMLITLWAPRSLYHPEELREIEHLLPKHDRPGVVTWILALALIGYVMYRFIVDFNLLSRSGSV